MGTDGLKADPDGLRRMATALRESTSGVDALSKSVPQTPEVTISSKPVGDTIAELLKLTGAIVAGVEDIANKIDASDGSYAEVDNRSAEDLYGVPKFTR